MFLISIRLIFHSKIKLHNLICLPSWFASCHLYWFWSWSPLENILRHDLDTRPCLWWYQLLGYADIVWMFMLYWLYIYFRHCFINCFRRPHCSRFDFMLFSLFFNVGITFMLHTCGRLLWLPHRWYSFSPRSMICL